MGDWSWSDQRQQWVYDPMAPSPGQNPAVTQILPTVTPSPSPRPRVEEPVDDHYLNWVPATDFPSFDDVDSRTIDDPGAPQ